MILNHKVEENRDENKASDMHCKCSDPFADVRGTFFAGTHEPSPADPPLRPLVYFQIAQKNEALILSMSLRACSKLVDHKHFNVCAGSSEGHLA